MAQCEFCNKVSNRFNCKKKCPRKFIRGHLSHLDIGEKKILLHIDFPHLHTARSLDAHKEDALA